MKKVNYKIWDAKIQKYWALDFANKREADSHLFNTLKQDYYDNHCGGLRAYIKEQMQHLRVVDVTPEKPKTKKQLELEEQERAAQFEESKKKEAEFIKHCKEQLAKNLHDLYDTTKITEDLVALKIDDVVVEVGSGEWYAYIDIIVGRVCVYRNDLVSVTKPMIFDKEKKLLFVTPKWLKRRSKDVKALVVSE